MLELIYSNVTKNNTDTIVNRLETIYFNLCIERQILPKLIISMIDVKNE